MERIISCIEALRVESFIAMAARTFKATGLFLHISALFTIWIWSAHAFNLEQPFRHPDCPLYDDPMHPIQLPYPTDCSKYYTCKNGYAYAMLCQNGLQWSTLTYRCDFPMVAKCSSAPNNPLIYPTNPTAGGTFPMGETVIYKSDATDCNKFYKCIPIRCPPFYYWNAVLERCDASQNVICEAPPQTAMAQLPIIDNSIPTAATPPSFPQAEQNPAILDAPQSSLNALCSTPGVEYARHPYDCHKFIQCDGFATVHTCPNDLYWNSVKMACDRQCQ